MNTYFVCMYSVVSRIMLGFFFYLLQLLLNQNMKMSCDLFEPNEQ